MALENPSLSVAGRLLVVLGFVVLGGVLAMAAFDIGPLRQRDILGPPWLGIASGAVFAGAGVAVGCHGLPRWQWLVELMGLVVCIGMAAVAIWIAMGPGDRQCQGGFSIAGTGYEGVLGMFGCRAAFSLGALMMTGVVCLMGASLLRRGLPWVARGVEWLGMALLVLGLLPLLLPLVLWLVLRAAARVAWTRLKTGKWPRNEAFLARRRKQHSGKPD